MSIVNKPSTVTAGLIFYMDMANTKSWRGPVTTNLVTSGATSIHTNWNNSGTATWSNDDSFVPRVFPAMPVLSMYKDTAGNSHIAHCYAPLSNGVTYTVSTYAYIPSNSGTLAGAVPYIRTFPANTSRGDLLFAGSNTWNLWPKDRWIRISNTFTNSANDTEIYVSTYLDNAGNKIYFTAPMIEVGNFATPYTTTSRSNTQALTDLMQTSTMTVNGLTYSSDGSFSFNGTTDKITLNTNTLISGTQNYTLEAAFRFTTASNVDFIFGNYGSANTGGLEYYVYQNRLNNYISGNVQSSTTLNPNQWYIAAVTRNGNTITHYLNGQPDGSGTLSSSIVANNPYTIGNGHDYTSEAFGGTIAMVKAYNRALTAAEIQQNFNALRGRYGI